MCVSLIPKPQREQSCEEKKIGSSEPRLTSSANLPFNIYYNNQQHLLLSVWYKKKYVMQCTESVEK